MSKVKVEKEIEFDAGHRVPNHKSKCKNPHGHRYRIVLGVEGEVNTTKGISDEGMVLDFGDLKALLEEIHDIFDHGWILYDQDAPMIKAMGVLVGEMSPETVRIKTVDFVPTAENLAIWIYNYIEKKLPVGYTLEGIKVYETPTSVAVYKGE